MNGFGQLRIKLSKLRGETCAPTSHPTRPNTAKMTARVSNTAHGRDSRVRSRAAAAALSAMARTMEAKASRNASRSHQIAMMAMTHPSAKRAQRE